MNGASATHSSSGQYRSGIKATVEQPLVEQPYSTTVLVIIGGKIIIHCLAWALQIMALDIVDSSLPEH